jgi:hypothetical protein
MVAERMAGASDPPDQLEVFLRHFPDHKKRRPRFVPFEKRKQRRGVLRMRAIIEGQRRNGFIGSHRGDCAEAASRSKARDARATRYDRPSYDRVRFASHRTRSPTPEKTRRYRLP